METATVILQKYNALVRYENCSRIGIVDDRLIFFDENGFKHITTSLYEVIYETN